MKADFRPANTLKGSPKRALFETKGAAKAAEVYEILKQDAAKAEQEDTISVILTSPDASTQKLLKSQIKAAGIEDVRNLPLLNGLSTRIESSKLKNFIENLPNTSRINVDRQLFQLDPHKSMPMLMEATREAGPSASTAVRLPGLDKVWDQGFTGKGQTVAIIDSGIYPHPDLRDRLVGWVDLSEGRKKPVDPFGHGTHVAGLVGGSGDKSEGKVKGVAPEANLVAVRIGAVSDAIKALQWVIDNKEKYDISVVNMSLGDYAAKSYKDDPWAQATQKAIDAGLTVVVAAGNEGPRPKTISTPGILPGVITVGAYDDKGTTDTRDDSLYSRTSRGPTIDGLAKPDVVAPGVHIYGPLSPGSALDSRDVPHLGKDYVAISGTSQATPMVAGLAAILKQANPQLTNHDIQQILIRSASSTLKEDRNAQGAGLVHADKALELALNWQPDSQGAAA